MYAGKWTNGLGSILEIDSISDDGILSGRYTTAVGDDGDRGQARALLGRCRGDLISFIVDYSGSGSIACWSGRYERAADEERIVTVWTLVRDASGPDDEPVEMWASFLTNSDRFVKGRQAGERPA